MDKLGEKYVTRFWPRELEALKAVNHPNTIRIYGIFGMSQKLFIFMEYANGGDIAGWLKKKGALEEPTACYWFTQASRAIEYCHTKLKIAHRDIKIDNVMLHNLVAKVTDFGFARKEIEGKGDMSTTFCGTMVSVNR